MKFFASFFPNYLVMSKKKRTFAPAFESRGVWGVSSSVFESLGMWRSPVAQRSGGPEVASSNLVIPTKRVFFGRLSFFLRFLPNTAFFFVETGCKGTTFF